jgi:hypothetical protein
MCSRSETGHSVSAMFDLHSAFDTVDQAFD